MTFLAYVYFVGMVLTAFLGLREVNLYAQSKETRFVKAEEVYRISLLLVVLIFLSWAGMPFVLFGFFKK